MLLLIANLWHELIYYRIDQDKVIYDLAHFHVVDLGSIAGVCEKCTN